MIFRRRHSGALERRVIHKQLPALRQRASLPVCWRRLEPWFVDAYPATGERCDPFLWPWFGYFHAYRLAGETCLMRAAPHVRYGSPAVRASAIGVKILSFCACSTPAGCPTTLIIVWGACYRSRACFFAAKSGMIVCWRLGIAALTVGTVRRPPAQSVVTDTASSTLMRHHSSYLPSWLRPHLGRPCSSRSGASGVMDGKTDRARR